jgi:hypothetical protein
VNRRDGNFATPAAWSLAGIDLASVCEGRRRGKAERMPREFRLPVDDAPDLVFSGKLIARVTSSPERRAYNFSRHAGRWTELALYQTEGGTYVCHETRRSVRAGERDRRRAEAVGTGDAVIAFFKQTTLAKCLYAEAGIAKSRRIR